MKIYNPSGFSSKLTGSFSGSFVGDGSNITSISSDNIEFNFTALSSSAQIAEDISGSFTSTSQSLASRIASQESFSSSLDSTFATDADLNLVSSSVDSLNAATSSYLLNTTDTLTGDLTVTGTITAQEFHTEYVSASIIYQSGSTQFGNSSDDTHTFTGTIGLGGSTITDSHLLNIQGSSATTNIGIVLNKTNSTAQVWGITNTGPLAIYNYTNSSEALRIDTNNNLGLGVTPSTLWSTSYNALQIGLGGSIYAHSSAGNAMKIGSNIVYEGTAPNYYDKYLSNSTATKYEQDAGTHAWYVAGSGTAGNAISWNEVMRIANNGNATFSKSDDMRVSITDTGDSSTLVLRADATNEIYTNTNHDLQIYTNGNQNNQLYLKQSNARVGIGTDNPASILHLYKSFDTADIALQSAGASGKRYEIGSKTDGSLSFYDANGTSTRLLIDTNGNVGIGTTGPDALLHLRADAPYIYFDDTNTTGTKTRFQLVNGDVGTTQSAVFGFNTTAGDSLIEVLTLNENGTVGVGTNAPDTRPKLHVYNNTNDGTFNSKIQAVFGNQGYIDSDATNIYGGGLSETQFLNGAANRPAMISLGGSLSTNESIGVINFFRSGNTDGYRSRALIDCSVYNNGTANQHGGRLRFWTANDGSTNPGVRMVIMEAGHVGIGTNSSSTVLQVHGQQKWYTTNADGNELRGFFNPGGSADNSTLSLYKADGSTLGLYFDSGQGILFEGSGDYLDDYEIGSWTPTYPNYSTGAPSSSSGRYTRIGKRVIATFEISGFSASTGNHYIIITGLPYVQYTASHIENGYCNVYPNGNRTMGIVINNSSGNSTEWYAGFNVTSTISSGGNLRGTIIYTTS